MLYNPQFQIIIMQSLPSQNYYFYYKFLNQFGSGSLNLSNFLMHQLFDYNNNLYILSTTGLIQINVPQTNSSSLLLLAVINLLPRNNYELLFGNIDLLYIINNANVYKVGSCLG